MSGRGKQATADDEVEQLLRAAQDDVLLKLNVDSHMARAAAASAAIDPDLDRRFQALKNPQKAVKLDDPAKTASAKANIGSDRVDDAAEEQLRGDDLFARFAALKNSLPAHGNKESRSGFAGGDLANQLMDEEEGEGEDEVQKVIRWATDAARLDPSPPSDDDNGDNDDDDVSDDDDDDDDDVSDDDDDRRKGRKTMNKK